MENLKTLVCGYVIGVANIIPGVSGGTFALILGLYSRLLGFLNRLNLKELQRLVSAFKSRKEKSFFSYLKDNDYFFIALIGTGALVGIISLSTLMNYLLKNQFEYTYSFFFGLIFVSLVIPFRLVKKWGVPQAFGLILGVVLTAGVAIAVNPADKTLNKSAIYEKQYQIEQGVKENLATTSEKAVITKSKPFAWIGKYTLAEYLIILFSGIIAVSAMVLPGISGSLVLILLGQYFAIIGALAGLKNLLLDDLVFLGATGVGVLIGLIGFAKVLEFALKKWKDIVLGFLCGLVAGSLYALWPFKSFVVTDIYEKADGGITIAKDMIIHSNQNILPSDLTQSLIALSCFAIGGIIMVFFVKHGGEDNI